VTTAHSLDGSVKIADPVAPLLEKGAVVLVDGAERVIERRSGTDARPIIRLSGSSTREDADGLRGTILFVPRSQVPSLGKDEWWATDLVGCSVHDGDAEVGNVRGVLGLPSCEALEVETPDERVILVPMVADALRAVDLTLRVIDVNLGFLGETK
jgi:16S rRNA processing protein RimM